MVRIAEAEASEPSDEELMLRDVRAYVRLKDTIATLTKDANAYRDKLAQIVEEYGEEDESGNRWLELPAEVDGVLSLKRERRVSQSLDTEAAEEILAAKGLKDRCFKLVPVLDEDEVMACLFEDLLGPDDIDAMFPKKITWAFVPSKRR